MIEMKHISKTYTRKGVETEALHQVNLKVNEGDIYGVIGYSGAGKSTLIRMINFLEKPTSGQVFINGIDLGSYSTSQLRDARKNIGMIFQHFNLLNSKTIFQNVAIPLVLSKVNKTQIKDRVLELLDFVGLADKAESYPNELSGGQKQRIGIARALASNPSVLLCDEATSALDPQTTDSILNLLKKINEEYNITILIITHEMSIIQKVCNRVAVMENGEIIEEGNVLDVFGSPQQTSTKKFVQTVIHDEIPASVKNKIKDVPNSRLFKVPFDQNDTNPIVNDLIRTFNITVNIVFASINEIKDDTIGYLVLQLIGEKDLLEKAAGYLSHPEIGAKELAK
ncbi:D-methionine transport system ATP-binding protein [Virgibacillus halotolerans]|uniref:methionine ABC transporter ATP-binding protein n=1 Tax=Virgibacillus halotolerans TaxID=1071053 RepID=UPI0019621C35|nr:ATP-binding cassette domain-containing protein [Virgibacillus halotolerans]MBM7598876.1 D-methionine transport system ATP-binding protein [Virgibacillus halotolerans]